MHREIYSRELCACAGGIKWYVILNGISVVPPGIFRPKCKERGGGNNGFNAERAPRCARPSEGADGARENSACRHTKDGGDGALTFSILQLYFFSGGGCSSA